MNVLSLPYIERRAEEERLRELLRNGLNPTPGHPKALVLCGPDGVGRRTLLRRVFASDPAFRKFGVGAQTHEILNPGGPSVARNAGEKAAEFSPGALGMVHPLLGLVVEAALLLGKDQVFRPRGADPSLDHSILECVEKPVLVAVSRVDPSNVGGMEDAARLIREASVRNTPLMLVFLDSSPSLRQSDASPGEWGTRTASDFVTGLRRFLPDDRQVTEVKVRPFAEAQIRQSFARLGLAPEWGALFYHFSEGQPASLAALWESLQRHGLLRHEEERRWKVESPAAAGAAWGAIRDRLIALIRARPATVREHEDRLINALHLAAAMGDTFLPVAVSEAVVATDPKGHAVDAEGWEDAWLDFLDFEDTDHPRLAVPATLDGHPLELKADCRRLFVYRFRDPAIAHLLSAALRRFWRGGAEPADPDPGTLLDAVERLSEWLVDHFRTSGRSVLAFRAALHRIQNQHADARALEELDYQYRLAASLAARFAEERIRVHGGRDARVLYWIASWAGEVWGTLGDYRQSLECWVECFHLVQAGRVTLATRDVASLWCDLATALWRIGRAAEAIPFLEQSIGARERLLGPEHPDTLTSVSNLGGVLHALGHSAAAEPYCRRALEARERVLGVEHPKTLSSMSNLGSVLQALGRPAEAEAFHRHALEARERVLGPEHPDTLGSVSHLGSVLQALGRHASAEPCCRRALEARERVLGPEHPDTLGSVNSLGLVLHALGRPADAEPYFERALEARERVLGPEHPDTLTSVNNLGFVLHALGRPADAEPYFRRAFEAGECLLGSEHPGTLASLGNLGAVLHALGRFAEAEPYCRRALEALERVLGADHPDTLSSVHNLGHVLDKLGRPAEAEFYFRRALDVRERLLGLEHPDTLVSMNELGHVLNVLGRPVEAELCFRRAFEARERVLGPDHPDTLTSAHSAGAMLYALGRPEDALRCFRRALEGRERVFGFDHPQSQSSREWVEGLARSDDPGE
ncbi:tetratricopeptide repeat protein [Longimicrobium sp.]|uniref:tetratricopeptide repeat protein n=1 Tax=Longimicrobium sp. TaxID=2029185 RepID=UPI002E32EE38|nr:tetratricopeptide repeat protein [Longimicrobium sp.]HEX6039606.1 tetratricopeptide repeat protein [Longimicrobium sp.]